MMKPKVPTAKVVRMAGVNVSDWCGCEYACRDLGFDNPELPKRGATTSSSQI